MMIIRAHLHSRMVDVRFTVSQFLICQSRVARWLESDQNVIVQTSIMHSIVVYSKKKNQEFTAVLMAISCTCSLAAYNSFLPFPDVQLTPAFVGNS